VPPETRMSFRVLFPAITGDPIPETRPVGQGTPEQVAADLRQLRDDVGVDSFQINFNGCHSLAQLLASMELLMTEVKLRVES